MSSKSKVGFAATDRLKNDYIRLKREPIPLVYAEVSFHFSKFPNFELLARSGEHSNLALLSPRPSWHPVRGWLLSWSAQVPSWFSLQTTLNSHAHPQWPIQGQPEIMVSINFYDLLDKSANLVYQFPIFTPTHGTLPGLYQPYWRDCARLWVRRGLKRLDC